MKRAKAEPKEILTNGYSHQIFFTLTKLNVLRMGLDGKTSEDSGCACIYLNNIYYMKKQRIKDGDDFDFTHGHPEWFESHSSFVIVKPSVDELLTKVNTEIVMNSIKNQLHPFASEYCIILFSKLVNSHSFEHDMRKDDVFGNQLNEDEPETSKCDFHSNKRIVQKVEYEYNFVAEK